MWKLARAADLNPPLSYIMTRMVLTVLPVDPFTCRLVSLISFLAASYFIYEFLRRKTTALFAMIGVLIFWSSSFIEYASEARPYALVLAFTALLILSWDGAISSPRPSRSLAALFFAGCGALLSHVLGLFAFAAIVIAEGVRTLLKRTVDWSVWAALAAPGVCLVTYIPLLRSEAAGLFPPLVQPTPTTALVFYIRLLYSVLLPLLIVGVVAIVWPWMRKKETGQPPRVIDRPLAALLLALLAVPAVEVGVFIRSKGAWFDRYGVVSLIALAILTTLLVARRTRLSRGASATVVAFLLVLFATDIVGPLQSRRDLAVEILSEFLPAKTAGSILAFTFGPLVLGNVITHALPTPPYLIAGEGVPLLTSLDSFEPKLPLVAASGLTFLEMDNREHDRLTSRLYYLTDRQAAVQIAHATLFEGFATLKHIFPIRASVDRYEDFIAAHRHFLVIGTYDYPEDWLLRKLEIDGARMRPIAKYNGYKDRDIYDVWVGDVQRPGPASAPDGRGANLDHP